MTIDKIKVWLSAAAIAAILSYVGPSLDDHGYEMRKSSNLIDAQKQAQREERFSRAAAKACGNGGYVLADGGIRCVNRKTHKTSEVVL